MLIGYGLGRSALHSDLTLLTIEDIQQISIDHPLSEIRLF
jgi:hypothetical protein